MTEKVSNCDIFVKFPTKWTLFKPNQGDPLPFPLRIWQILHCQIWLTNQAEEWHQVSESNGWPRACGRTRGHRNRQMSSTWETCGGKSCGLGGITIPASAVGLKGLSLLSGGLIGQTDNNVMVIFPDSQQSLPASWKGEVGHVMALRKASPVVFANTVGLKSLKTAILRCHFYSYFFLITSSVCSGLLSSPLCWCHHMSHKV